MFLFFVFMSLCFFLVALICLFFFFFFSSRRRHTRSLCDWSSDVCSSDLRGRPRQQGFFPHPEPLEGNQNAITVPWSSPALVAQMRPPWRSISCRQIASPRPSPGICCRSEERRVGKEGRSAGWAYMS